MTSEVSLIRLVGAHVCLHAAMSGIRVAAPLYALHKGHSAFEVGLLFSLFSLTAVFLSVHAGRLADRLPFAHIVSTCVAVAVLSVGTAAAFPSYTTLCIAALGSGGAVSFALVTLQRFASQSANDATQLKKVFSWLGIGPSLSNFVGPVLAGLVIDHFGYRWAFAVLAALPLCTWGLIRGVNDAKPVQALPTDAEAPAKAWDLLRLPQFKRLLAVNWALSAAWDVHSFMVPVLGHEFGFSASTVGTIVGSFAVAATAVRLALPTVAAHLVEWRVIVGVCVWAGVVLAVYPFLSQPWLMGMGSVALGMALGSVQPMMLSTLHQITPANRLGEALGLRSAVTNLCSVLMPLGFGAAGAAVGVKAVFWACSVMALATSKVAAGLRLKGS